MDKIKKYLQENKASLDTDLPEAASWGTLASRIRRTHYEKGRRLRKLIIGGIAASLLLSAAGFGLWRLKSSHASKMIVENSRANNTDKPSQAKAVYNDYSPLILREITNLKATSFYGSDTSRFKAFSFQWKELEANEKAIEEKIESAGFNELLLDQLANNYQLKVRLLKQFAAEINKVKSYLPPADTLIKTPSLSLLGI
jgi:hypothetical protein